MGKRADSARGRPPRAGDRAAYRIGTSRFPVVILEVRGPIGYQGRRIVFVKPPDADMSEAFELPEEVLEY